MIRLFRHDGLEIMLNIDMIKEIRSGQPTIVILTDGEMLQVKNTQTDVMAKIRAQRKGEEDEKRATDPEAAWETGGRRTPRRPEGSAPTGSAPERKPV